MLLLTNQFHDLFEGLSRIWHKKVILCPTKGQHLRSLPANSTVHRTCLALARELSLAKMKPTNPRAFSIQQKFQFEISEIHEPNGSVHSACTDPTQATARLVIVLVARIQCSSTGDNNFVKWKGTFRSNRRKWPDRWKRTTFKEHRGKTSTHAPGWAFPVTFSVTLSNQSLPRARLHSVYSLWCSCSALCYSCFWIFVVIEFAFMDKQGTDHWNN